MSFQTKTVEWLKACFPQAYILHKKERNDRFLEEALELVQAHGGSAEDAHRLVDYVFSRPVGEPAQEAGGVLITLAALCHANGIDMNQAGETELSRCWKNIEKISKKQKTKPRSFEIPGYPPV